MTDPEKAGDVGGESGRVLAILPTAIVDSKG